MADEKKAAKPKKAPASKADAKKPAVKKAAEKKTQKTAPHKSEAVKVAEEKIAEKRVYGTRTEGAEQRVLAILSAFNQPMLRSEITQRMTLWSRDARDSAIDKLVRGKKIKVELCNVGRRGRPGQMIELAA